MAGQVIEKSALLCIEDRKLLCARSKGKALFYFPGGKRETNESAVQALIREIREELGVSMKPFTIRQIGIFEGEADGKPGVTVKFTCFMGDFEGEVHACGEIEELAWIPYDQKERVARAGWEAMDHLRRHGLL